MIQTHPELLKEWDYNLNEITPDSISWHYSKKVYWVCRKGHVFCSAPNRRARLGVGCPTCAKEGGTSFPEQSIYYYLDSVIPTENRYIYKGVEIDIYIPSLKLGIEYDGKYYHNSKKSCIKETKKDNFLKGEGVRLIRIKECDDCRVVKNIIYTIPTKKHENLKSVISIILHMIGIEQDIDIDPNRDRIAILEKYIVNEKKNSIVVKLPEVAKQWDYEKNGKIKPEFIRAASNVKFWWKCEKGHSWEATVASRANGNGCPYCSGKVLLVGENDLQSQNPELAKEWNFNRNGELSPDKITVRNGKKVWWKCAKCSHEWKTSVAHRSEGKGCPKCGKIKNHNSRYRTILEKSGSFAQTSPELLLEWNYEKNQSLDPNTLTRVSGKKVWWKCNKCGHQWEAIISNRVKRGSGCPICKKELLAAAQIRAALKKTGSIKLTHPQLLKDWDYEKNIITPDQITIGSDRKVWWKCHNCGHNWEESPNSRIKKNKEIRKCPNCKNNNE